MTTTTQPKPTIALISILLPGPDRKREPAAYLYRVTYRNPQPAEPGCVATWGVLGGRDSYQVSAERTAGGELLWHCTCPDAVYRRDIDRQNRHYCKHIRGLTEVFETIGLPVCARPAAA